jgi:hypothetical protein
MIHFNGLTVSQVSNIERLISNYKKQTTINVDKNAFPSEEIISGIVLSAKFKTIHSKKNNMIGLLELSIVDEWCALNPVLYQCWGQSAADKFRYLILRGCSVTIANITVSQPMDSPYVIRGDIICVRGGLVSSVSMERDSALISPALCESLFRLERWADIYPLTSLIRHVLCSHCLSDSNFFLQTRVTDYCCSIQSC